MFSFLSNLSDRAKLLVAVLVITVISVSFFLIISMTEYAIILGVAILAVLVISYPVWLPESKTRIRLASLALAGTAFIGSIWPNIYVGILQYISPEFAKSVSAIPVGPTIPVLIFIFLVIVVVNYFSRDTTAMGKHETAIDKDIPDPTFKEKMRGVVEALVDDLKSIDNKTNWSMSYFTPLDAEVEVNTGRGREKRITELLSAIKRSKERLFMVLGDPGSGKSVALRKLARDLAAESEKTGKIPVYINLKEWYVEEKWTEEQPPTVEQLNTFVLRNLKNRDIVTTRFFDKYYDRLYETGRLYFIFDSFDEIPSVLDERDGSFLIHRLSEVIFRFLKGARLESQGVLASRIYRKPTNEFQSNVTLEIRPFSEEKIIQTLKRSNIYSKELAERLFKERPELVPIAKNPFMATLVADFAENNQNRLPANQAEMYRSYIEKTLDDCSDRLERKNIDKATVYTCCDVLAREMFEVYGLEAPIDKIRKKYPELPLDEVTDILRFARLGRGVSNDVSKFSFVHRRFAEYFFVQSMLAGEVSIQPDSIPTDSQQRDALVLYCEVAEFEKAKSIADYCWSVIAEVNNPMDLRSIHCLRFLRDAFRGRKECIAGFQDALKAYIEGQLTEESNLVSAKLATEAIGLMDKEGMEMLLSKSLLLNNLWISEYAVKSCWHIENISSSTKRALCHYFQVIPIFSVIYNFNTYRFFLKLSSSFFIYYRFNQIRIVRLFVILLLSIFLLISSPGLILAVLFFLFISVFFGKVLDASSIRSNKGNKLTFILKKNKFIAKYNEWINSISKTFDLFLNKILPKNGTEFDVIIHEYLFLLLMLTILAVLVNFEISAQKGGEEFLTSSNNIDQKIQQLFFSNNFLYFFILISFIRYHVYFMIIKLKAIRKFKIHKQSLIKNTIMIGVSVFLFYSFAIILITLMLIIEKTEAGFSDTLSIASIAFFVYAITDVSIKSIRNLKKYEIGKRTIHSTMNRETIQSVIIDLSKIYQIRYLQELESHVKTVTGEWPDPFFLSDKNSEAITRLAKLEEKWLGLDR